MTITLELDVASTDSHTRRILSEISLAVAKSKKIVVVTGAGISCSCGIPDFRSSNGLYALVKEKYPDVVMRGRDLFDASLFRDPISMAVFYSFISGLKRSIDAAKPSPTHHFIKVLDEKKKLLRSYTQNIDGLETRVGLLGSSCQEAKSSNKGKTKIRTKDVRNVQLHGDIHRVRCITCFAEYPCTEEHLTFFEKGTAPDCPECLSRSEARKARSARAIRVGSLRPAIVLYEEPHPLGDDIGAIHTADLSRKPDMLIIMGTSMKVHGLKKLVKEFARAVHSSSGVSNSKKLFNVLFVNKTAPAAEWSDIIDYHISGESDHWSTQVIGDWKKMRPADWEIQQTLVGRNGEACSIFKSVKTAKPSKTSKLRQPLTERENVGPTSSGRPQKSAVNEARPEAPLSPTKRRKKTSHYDDLESSPSKRQAKSEHYHAMPANERRMLFIEKTNHPTSAINDVENSKMDTSLCDSSMRDVMSGGMDTNILELSMIDAGAIVEERSPIKPRTKTRSKVPEEKRKTTARMVTRPHRTA